MGTLERLLQELATWPKVEGITMADVLELSEPLSTALRKMTVAGSMSLHELATELMLSAVETRQVGEVLVEKGFVSSKSERVSTEVTYQINLARTRSRDLPSAVWQALDGLSNDET